MENGTFQATKSGTIQGGTISPLLACIALHGMEKHIRKELASELFQYLKKKYGKASNRDAQTILSVIFYADDFVVIHESEEIILKAKILIEQWLKTIGLELKPSKTKISHTLYGKKPGFDFLGFSIRHYLTNQNKKGYKLLIKPSRESISQHMLSIKHKLKGLRGVPQEAVIKHLNPIIRGWSQYYTSVISSEIFCSLDNAMHKKLWKWAVFRHHNKGKRWIKKKYFKKYGNDNWKYATNNKLYLIRHRDHAIKRHTKIGKNRSPYDGDWTYWGKRLGKIPGKSPQTIKLLKLQQGKCNYCHLWFRSDDLAHVHHIDRNRRNNNIKNLSLLHKHCHDQLHKSIRDKYQITEEPDDGQTIKSGSEVEWGEVTFLT